MYARFMLARLSACSPVRCERVRLPEELGDRVDDAAAAVHRLEHELGRLLPLPLAAAVELLRQLLALARRTDVDAHLHGERDRRAERVELRVGAAEARD